MFVQTGSIASLLSLLTPWEVGPQGKIKYGNHYGDGGYVMMKTVRPEQVVYSFGIGQNPAFDLDLARRGNLVYMFDHTIERVSAEHENFRFYREGIAGTDDPAKSLYSLDHYMIRFGHEQSDMILKIDVEGAEWESILATPDARLCQFEQIVFEFHRFHLIEDVKLRALIAGALEKLNRHFTLHHVHANNFADVTTCGGLAVCPVIETSYVRSDLVERRPSRTVFPTGLDTPCNAGKRDLMLTMFPFLPALDDAALLAARIEEVATRIEYQHVLHGTRARVRALEAS